MVWILLLFNFFIIKTDCSVNKSSDHPVAESLKSLSPGPPVLKEHPISTLVQGSKPIRLYCRAEGNPVPKISWLKDGSPLASAEVRDVVKLPTGDLMFLKVHDKDEEGSTTGIYQCVATNAYGSVRSQNVSVQVASLGNEFRKQPNDAIAAVGGAVTIQCQGPRGIPEPEISWTKNSRRVLTNDRVKVKPGGNLRITALRKSDSGDYQCVATNTVGSRKSSAAELRVQEPPRFLVRPSNSQITVGQTIVLECKAGGDPSPRIRWSKRGGKLSSRCKKLRGGRLKLIDVQLEDQGQYVCSAENPVGKESSIANITVQMKPEIVRKSSVVTSQVGGKATLECRVRGNPEPIIFWRNPNGVELFLEKSFDNGRLVVDSNGDMIIKKATFEDQGLYKCQASSSLGSVTADIQLVIKSKASHEPPPVIAVVPWNTTALLGSTVELHCSARDSTIRWYKEDQLIESGSERFHQLNSGNLRITNVQLQDSGSYTCKASNKNGIDSWSALLNTTSDPASATPINFNNNIPNPPSRPVTINSTSDCIFVTWTSPHDSPKINYYIISYYLIGSDFFAWTQIANVYETSYVVCNLKASSKYVFLVRGVNGNGIGRASSISDVIQSDDELSAATSSTFKEINSISTELVQATRLSAPGSNIETIRLEWKTNGNCESVDGFMLITQPVSSSSVDLVTHQAPCSSRSYDLTELRPTVKYEVRIRPLKKQRAGRASPIMFVSLETGLISPTAPSLFVKSKGRDVTLYWKPPPDVPSTFVIGYKVRYRSRDSQVQRVINVNSSTTEVVLKQLDSNKTYDATVTYRTQMGEGVTSEAMEVFVEISIIDTMLSNPGIIAAAAGGFLLVCIMIVAVILYCKRSRRKTRFQGKKQNREKSCFEDFELRPVVQQSPRQQFDAVEHAPLAYASGESNVNHMFTKVSRNTGMRKKVDEGFSSTAFNTPGYELQDGQFNMEATWEEMGKLSTEQQMTKHHQYLRRHQSESSAYVASNLSEPDSKHFDHHCIPYSSSDLPPPPPAPPISPSTARSSQRSRTDSALHSTGDRSSRSGHRGRRSIRSKRQANAARNLLEDSQSEVTTTPLLGRPNEASGTPSSIPPIPPPRDDSSYVNTSIDRNPLAGNQYPRSNLLYLDDNRDIKIYKDANQLGDLKSHRPNVNYNPRNSTNVSNLSMMNGYGSESDARDSFCDHHSDNFSCSDNESFNMDSVSQVGPNRRENHNEYSRDQKLYSSDSHKHHYPHTYNNYPLEGFARNDSKPSTNPLLRKAAEKFHHTKALNSDLNRANSTGSFSSYHQSTGDSGMSAGVGCSTAQSSSLKSYISAGSAGRTVACVSRSDASPTGNSSMTPDDARFLSNHDLAAQKTSRLINSSASTTMPSNDSRPNNHIRINQGYTNRIPTSHNRLQESKRHLKIHPSRTPLSPIQSPDLPYSADENNFTSSSNHASSFNRPKANFNEELGNKSLQLRQHELSDVPELSTSDFCEN